MYGDYLSESTTVGKGTYEKTYEGSYTKTANTRNAAQSVSQTRQAQLEAQYLERAISDATDLLQTEKSITYGYYQDISEKKATPAEAYVLQYIEQNTNSYSFVQYAWWEVFGGSTSSGSSSDNVIYDYDENDYSDDNPFASATEDDAIAARRFSK